MEKLFRSSSTVDYIVENATSGTNTSENWEKIMEVCDYVKNTPNSDADVIRSILKRLNCNIPHNAILALTLLDACIKNCDRNFHLKVCSRDFEAEIKRILKKGHPKVVEKMQLLLKEWSENIFKNDPEFGLIPSLYSSLRNKNGNFLNEPAQTNSTISGIDRPNCVTDLQSECDLAKAIELSLKVSGSPYFSSVYPSVTKSSSTTLPEVTKEPRKVRALYDFTAAEDNELTFKAEEIILVLEDKDANWWKGSNHRGEGLFPANFVCDLNAETQHEPEHSLKSKKKVQFDEEVEVITFAAAEFEPEIDEGKIDRTIDLLHEADPTGERPDSEELLVLEESCLTMIPLINKELEKIDRQIASLTEGNRHLLGALNLYQTLKKDSADVSYNAYLVSDMRYPYSVAQYHAVPGNYISPDSYQPMSASHTVERYLTPMPASGVLQSTIPTGVVHSTPYIPYDTALQTSYASISHTETAVPMSTANFTAPLLSRDQNGMYYSDIAISSMPTSSASSKFQHQPAP